MDIKEELLDAANQEFTQDGHVFRLTVCRVAADEIERLREQCEFEKKCRNDAFEELKQRDADIERLRDTLVKIVSFHEVCMKDKKEIMIFLWGDRAALKEGE